MPEIHTPFGRAFEDFHVGDVIRHWPGRTLSQSDNLLFSLLSQNQHPLHIDAHYAAQTAFGKTVLNGILVFSVSVGQTVGDISGAAIAHLEYENIVHLLPAFEGDTIYTRTEILAKQESKSKPDRGIVQVETTTANQRNEDILRFRSKLLISKQEYAQRPHTHQSALTPMEGFFVPVKTS